MVESLSGRRKKQSFFIPVWTSNASSCSTCIPSPICLCPRGCSHSWSLWVIVACRTELSLVWRGHRDLFLWNAGEGSCGHNHLPARAEWGAVNDSFFQGFHRMAGKGLLKVADDVVVLHFPPAFPAGMSDPNRFWVLSQSAWRSGAATQSALDLQEKWTKETNQTSWR